ncbi:MAG: DUF3352 domain-containing protein, partial [Chthoniobacteraceae bacterium]|nr:DUF3352 domain-containing protein [Chthoniobacteraceae bacterium]
MKLSPALCWFPAALLLASPAGCQKQAAPLPPQAPPSQPSPAPTKIVSAEPTSFDAIARHLDTGGGLYFFLSTESFLKAASQKLTEWGPMLMDASKMDADGKAKAEAAWKSLSHFTANSGIKEITGFGLSSIALEPGYYQNKWMLHHAAGNGNGLLWKIHGSEPNALDFIAYLPEHTALATSGNTKLAPIWDALNQEAATNADLRQGLDTLTQQFQQMAGLNLPALLASLGPNYSLILTLDETRMTSIPGGPNGQPITLPEPALALFIQVQDDVLINRVDQQLSALPMITKADEGDLKIRGVSMPLPMPFLRPVVAWKKGLIMVSSSEPLLREMMDVKAGKKPGLAAQAGFKKLMTGLPTVGCDFGYVSPALQKAVQDFQMNTLKQGQNTADPAVQKMMEQIYKVGNKDAVC